VAKVSADVARAVSWPACWASALDGAATTNDNATSTAKADWVGT